MFDIHNTEQHPTHTLNEGIANADDGYSFDELVDETRQGWRLRNEFGDWPFHMVWTKGTSIMEYRERTVTVREFKDALTYRAAVAELPKHQG